MITAHRDTPVCLVRSTCNVKMVEELSSLATELPRCLGGRKASVLAVGSVGRAYRETGSSEQVPANDYDIIIVAPRLTESERLLSRRRINSWLKSSASRFSVPISVGILRWSDLPNRPFTLFNYEMRYGSQLLSGMDPTTCMPPYPAEQMPLIEATRLLLNRGVLLWGERLGCTSPAGANAVPYVGERRAKALLAIGDALMIMAGAYHWSYRGRLRNLADCTSFQRFDGGLRARYAAELETRISGTRHGSNESDDVGHLLSLHAAVLRFVEERRLNRSFASWSEYAEVNLQYPQYLTRSRLKRLLHLIAAFGPPRGRRFYRKHVSCAPEEVLMRAFPKCAYEQVETKWLEGALNWQASEMVTPVTVCEAFQRAWERAG